MHIKGPDKIFFFVFSLLCCYLSVKYVIHVLYLTMFRWVKKKKKKKKKMDHVRRKHTCRHIKGPVKIWISLRIHGGWSESSPDWYFMQTGKKLISLSVCTGWSEFSWLHISECIVCEAGMIKQELAWLWKTKKETLKMIQRYLCKYNLIFIAHYFWRHFMSDDSKFKHR